MPANTTSYTDNTVTVGYTYEYKVNACNSYGCSGDSNTVTITATSVNSGNSGNPGNSGNSGTVPAVPTALYATNSQTYSGVINLGWVDNSSNETGFSVYRRQSGSGATTWTLLTITSLPANTTSYTDNTVTVGYTYEYKVNACNSYGCSGDSNTVTITASSGGGGGSSSTPSAPTGLYGYYSQGLGIPLTWNSSNSSGTFTIYKRSSGGAWTQLVSNITTTSYTDYVTQGTVATNYEYYVVACNGSICSAESPSISVSVPAGVTYCGSYQSPTYYNCTCAGNATAPSGGYCQCPYSYQTYSSNGCN